MKIRMIRICKAQAVGDQEVPNVRVLIEFPVEDQGSLEEHWVFFDAQATKLESALFVSLPGGTYDRVLCKMLERKASLFVVPHWDTLEEVTDG